MEKIKTAKITWLEKQQETVKRNKFMQNDKKIILTRINKRQRCEMFCQNNFEVVDKHNCLVVKQQRLHKFQIKVLLKGT